MPSRRFGDCVRGVAARCSRVEPVVGITPVDGDDHAVALMNDSVFGLTASIWAADVDAALAVGDRVETGTWYLNSCDYLDPALAWTGVKHSGRGSRCRRSAS